MPVADFRIGAKPDKIEWPEEEMGAGATKTGPDRSKSRDEADKTEPEEGRNGTPRVPRGQPSASKCSVLFR